MASAEYVFKADEKPAMAGSPYKPRLSPARRGIYFVVGLFLGTCDAVQRPGGEQSRRNLWLYWRVHGSGLVVGGSFWRSMPAPT